jgi:thiol peroxidase
MSPVETAVTLKGNPVTLTGKEVKVGQAMPEAVVVANDLSEVKLSSYKGKRIILSLVPSLDTPICDLQTKRFSQEVAKLGGNTIVLTISMDLPFAQKRWCGATGTTNVVTLSDYRYAQVGENYGVLIKGLRLLARSIFVIDSKGTVQYKQIVPEIAQEPDYQATLAALQKVN